MTSRVMATPFDLRRSGGLGDTLGYLNLWKRFRSPFPPLTDESRFCRDGNHASFWTPFGRFVVVSVAIAVTSGAALLIRWILA